jgi:hypothetical protein
LGNVAILDRDSIDVNAWMEDRDPQEAANIRRIVNSPAGSADVARASITSVITDTASSAVSSS